MTIHNMGTNRPHFSIREPILKMYRQGMNYNQIAYETGYTKNCIIALIMRDKELKVYRRRHLNKLAQRRCRAKKRS